MFGSVLPVEQKHILRSQNFIKPLEPGWTGFRVWIYPRSGKISFPLSSASKDTKRKTGSWMDRLQGLIISQIRQNHLLSTFLSLKKQNNWPWIDRLQDSNISQIRQNHLLSPFLTLQKKKKMEPGSTGCRVWIYSRSAKNHLLSPPVLSLKKLNKNRIQDWQVAGFEYIPDQPKITCFPPFLSLKKQKQNRILDRQVAGFEYIPDQVKSPAFPLSLASKKKVCV